MVYFAFWDVSRGEVETFSIWQGRLKVGHGFAGVDFTETPSQERIQDSGFNPFREFSLGFQERRTQNGSIKVVQRQHGGTLSRLVCDPGISLLDNSTTIRDVNIVFYCPKFTFGRPRGVFLDEWSSEELTEFV